MSHWNHRVIEFTQADGSKWLAIHEVHYDDDGLPFAYAESPADVSGESAEELSQTLEWMRAAIGLPHLAESDFRSEIERD